MAYKQKKNPKHKSLNDMQVLGPILILGTTFRYQYISRYSPFVFYNHPSNEVVKNER